MPSVMTAAGVYHTDHLSTHAARLQHLLRTGDRVEVHKCVERTHEAFCMNVREGWSVCRDGRLPLLLRNVILDRSTYSDPTYSAAVLSFFADIVEYASGLDRRVRDRVVDELLAWGDKIWETLLVMLQTIVHHCRLFPCLGTSLAELTLAYNNLYCERDKVPKLIGSDFGRLVMCAWACRIGSGPDDRALHIFETLRRRAPAAQCSSFCQRFVNARSPDEVVLRFRCEFNRTELSGANFGAALRGMCFMGGAGGAPTLGPALVRHDVFRSLYEALCRQTNVDNREEEWCAIRGASEFLWTLFTGCFDMNTPRTYRHVEYLMAFMARASIIGPNFENHDASKHLRLWLQLHVNLGLLALNIRKQNSRHAVPREIRRLVHHHFTRGVVMNALDEYRSRSHETRAYRNGKAMMNAWFELGMAAGLPGKEEILARRRR
ncbi:hypothetical protein DENSPDRAFT_929995 [Dentipellis sp. KUC8613]|nr:hypothetical protein DENSPDRAFT_929995 [Dentipellis sp. KUC8613]